MSSPYGRPASDELYAFIERFHFRPVRLNILQPFPIEERFRGGDRLLGNEWLQHEYQLDVIALAGSPTLGEMAVRFEEQGYLVERAEAKSVPFHRPQFSQRLSTSFPEPRLVFCGLEEGMVESSASFHFLHFTRVTR